MGERGNSAITHERQSPIRRECGAKTKAGGKCRAPAMSNGRCRVHGGASLSGPASATWKHGRYSKALPAALQATYQEALNNPDLMSLQDDIALLQVRINQLLQQVSVLPADTGDKLKTLAGQADLSPDDVKQLRQLITDFASEAALWRQSMEALEQHRKTTETERRQLIQAQQIITSQEAMTLIAALINIVRQEVQDRQVLQRIQLQVNRIIDKPKASE